MDEDARKPKRRLFTPPSRPGNFFKYGKIYPILIFLPALLIVLIINVFPLFYALWMSFNRYSLIMRKWIFVGFKNYQQMLYSKEFWEAAARSGYFVLVTVVVGTIMALLTALVLNERFRGRGFVRSSVLLPWCMAPVTVGILWAWMMNAEFGSINVALERIGLIGGPIAWLGNGFLALNMVALVFIWYQSPLLVLLFLAGLQTIPANQYAAAKVDGANGFQRFIMVTLPGLKSTLLLCTVLMSIYSLLVFDVIYIITGGGPGSATSVMTWLGYTNAFHYSKYGEGAAALYLLSAVCILLAFSIIRLFREKRRKELAEFGIDSIRTKVTADGELRTIDLSKTTRSAGKKFSVKKIKLAFLSTPLGRRSKRAAFWSAVILIALWALLPYIWLINMSLMDLPTLLSYPVKLIAKPSLVNYDQVFFPTIGHAVGVTGTMEMAAQSARIPRAILNSIVVASLTMVLNVVFGALAGYALARNKDSRFFKRGLNTMILSRLVPGMALILPFFMLARLTHLYDTYWGLILAYTSFILPISVWVMKTFFENVPESIERSGYVDGCTRLQCFFKILFRVAKPGLFATALVCFLMSWNEFLFAFILTGSETTQTIPVILAGYIVQARINEYGPLFAASVLSVFPAGIIAFLFQRHLIQGMVSGAVKG